MIRRYEIIFAGAGGQGLVQAGSLLGEATVKGAALHASCSQAFGVASRGGLARSEVVISSEEITYPFAMAPDIVVILTTAALAQLRPRFAAKTIIIADQAVSDVPSAAISLPIADTALALGTIQNMNMVALGAVMAIGNPFSVDHILQTLATRYGESNHRLPAVRAGYDLGVPVCNEHQ